MDTREIQMRVDQMVRAMLAKGLPQPQAEFEVRANMPPRVALSWHEGEHSYSRHYELVDGNDAAEIVNDAAALISDLPSAEENRRNAFLASLGKVIDLGRANGIEVDFINPLVATMKRLSENAITDRRTARPEMAEGV